MRDRDRGGSVLSFLIGRETSPPMRKCNTEISKSKTREGMVWREVGVSLAVSDSENSLFKLAKYFCCLLCFPVQCLMAPCGLQKIAVNLMFWHIYIYPREETSFSPSFTAAFWQTVKSARIRFYPTFLQDLSEGLWQHISGISPPLYRGFSLFVNITMDICQRSRYEDKYLTQSGDLIAIPTY